MNPIHDYNHALRLIEEECEARTGFLDIGNCGLTEIPPEVGEMDWLWGLNLGSWYIDKKGNFNLSLNKGSYNQIQGEQLVHLRALQNLNQLDLSYNQIQGENLLHLKPLQNLNQLDLSSNQIQSLHGFPELQNLNQLDLSYNQIQEVDDLRHIQNPSIEDLKLYGNPVKGFPKILLGYNYFSNC